MPTSDFSYFKNASGIATELECETDVRRLLDDGQIFLAYDRAQDALKLYPDNARLKQMSARCLVRAGALQEARVILEALCPPARPDASLLARFYTELQQSLAGPNVETDRDNPAPQTLLTLARLLNELSLTVGGQTGTGALNEETQALLGSVYKRLWKRDSRRETALQCRDTYLLSYMATSGYWSGINVAAMSWLLGERELAHKVAGEVLDACRKAYDSTVEDSEQYWLQATIGEACLYLDRIPEALAAYQLAATLAGKRHAWIVSSLQQLRMLAEHHFAVPSEIFDILKSAPVVVFTGHMLDRSDRATPRFPARLEPLVRSAIEAELDALGPQFGYCSAACGADILFIEAMLDRGAEVTIVLPFAEDDFIRECVEYAGPSWVRRFRSALQSATAVKYLTQEPLLGDDSLFAFLGQMFQGYAFQHARTLENEPHLLAVWDGVPLGLQGGTSDLIASWPDPTRLHHISTRDLLAALEMPRPENSEQARPLPPLLRQTDNQPDVPKAAQTEAPQVVPAGRRQIKTMMFADVVGYSKLHEEDVPFFMHRFLKHVASSLPASLPFVNTWGDAIYVVMDHAIPLAEYALKLKEVVCDTDWHDPLFDRPPSTESAAASLNKESSLNRNAAQIAEETQEETTNETTDKNTGNIVSEMIGEQMASSNALSVGSKDTAISIRIALHAGPIYEAIDPLTLRRNYYGAQVNRAARMEPVTMPGHIYASEQFVGLLIAEQVEAEVEAHRHDQSWRADIVCDPLGTLALAKNFGTQVTYHLRRD